MTPVRTAVCALLLLAAPAVAQEPPAVRPFAAVGGAALDRPAAFDRWAGDARGRGPSLFVQAGVDVRIAPRWSVAGLFGRAVDANRDGADIDFALGELRVRLSDVPGAWMALGGGRVRGSGRKGSFVETLAFGKDLGPRAYAELRAITDEGDGNLTSLGVGWRF